MSVLDTVLDLRVWPLMAAYLLVCVPLHRRALNARGLTLPGILACQALILTLTALAYPAVYGLHFAPSLPALLGAPGFRIAGYWSLLWTAAGVILVYSPARNRYANLLLSSQTFALCMLLFAALRDHLHMQALPALPGPEAPLATGLAICLAELVGRRRAAPGTVAFSPLTLQIQALILLANGALAGRLIAL